MKLISDGAPCSHCQHMETFIFQRCLIFQRMEISPVCMEFSGHSNHLFSEITGISAGCREVIISPAAAWQRFQLQMAVFFKTVLASWSHMRSIVKDRCLRRHAVDKFADLRLKFIQHMLCVPHPFHFGFGIHSKLLHLPHTMLTLAVYLEQNIHKNSIQIFHADHLDHILKLILEKLSVTAVQTDRVIKMRRRNSLGINKFSIFIYCKPLRMLAHDSSIPLCSCINRHFDPSLMTRLDLLQ